jgi:hypothetical protein
VADRLERFRADLRAELTPWQHSVIFRIGSLTQPFCSRLVYRLGRQPWILEQNYEVLRQFQNFCRDRGYDFSVVFNHTIDSLSDWRSAPFAVDDVDRPLRAFCECSGIPAIDMREEFKKEGNWEQYINQHESHYSARGMRKTALAIYQKLLKPELVIRQARGTAK